MELAIELQPDIFRKTRRTLIHQAQLAPGGCRWQVLFDGRVDRALRRRYLSSGDRLFKISLNEPLLGSELGL